MGVSSNPVVGGLYLISSKMVCISRTESHVLCGKLRAVDLLLNGSKPKKPFLDHRIPAPLHSTIPAEIKTLHPACISSVAMCSIANSKLPVSVVYFTNSRARESALLNAALLASKLLLNWTWRSLVAPVKTNLGSPRIFLKIDLTWLSSAIPSSCTNMFLRCRRGVGSPASSRY